MLYSIVLTLGCFVCLFIDVFANIFSISQTPLCVLLRKKDYLGKTFEKQYRSIIKIWHKMVNSKKIRMPRLERLVQKEEN